MFSVLVSRYHTYASDGGGIKWVLVQCSEICKCRSSGEANRRLRPHVEAQILINLDSSEEVLSKGHAAMTTMTTVAITGSRESPAELGFHDVHLRLINAEGFGVDITNFSLLVITRGPHSAHPLRKGEWSSFSRLTWETTNQ